jgi:DNA-binding XRE family transcriptional regulator
VKSAITLMQKGRADSAMQRKTASGDGGPDAPGAKFADGQAVELRTLFGSNFRAARQKAGLTQRDVEARTGIKQHYVSQIESGKQNPTLGTMAALAWSVNKDVINLLRPPRSRTSAESERSEPQT